MFAVLMTLAAVTSAGATPAQDQAVETAISHCLGSFSAKLPPASAPDRVPPGLIEGTGVSVAPIAGEDHAFSYEGTNPREMTCGVAVYGPVSRTMRQRITSLVEGNPRWKPHAATSYDLSKRFPDAEETYWGDPLAPSMTGVAMLSRKPSPQAPTLEVQYHSVMVQ
jgi:hypothetical protein